MSQEPESETVSIARQCLEAKLSRSQVLKAVGVGLVAAALPGAASADTGTSGATGATAGTGTFAFPFTPQVQGRYTTESVPTIINIAQTMEYLATTLVNAGVTNASSMNISGLTLQALQAALAEEVYHVQFLASMGATPMTTTFTVPDPTALTSAPVFFRTLELLETICNAAYMTANREFAELGQPLLAKFAYQAGSVEAEHRMAARTALALLSPTAGPAAAGGTGTATGGTPAPAPWTGAPGTAGPTVANPIPPNNKAFETDYFLYLADAAALVQSLGFIGGKGTALSFPGTATALTNAGAPGAAVTQQLPNNATASITATTVAADLTAIGVTGVIAPVTSGSSGS